MVKWEDKVCPVHRDYLDHLDEMVNLVRGVFRVQRVKMALKVYAE